MTKLEVLSFLKKHAGDISLTKAFELALEVDSISRRCQEAENALGVLSEQIIGLDDNGRYPPGFDRLRPAVVWAIKRARYFQASIVCGPVTNGMDLFLEKMDEYAERHCSA